MWYKRLGKWLRCMSKMYQEWVHEVELSYHMLGLRHTLIQQGLRRRVEALCDTYSLPEAKCPCTIRKITGRIRSSMDSPMSVP